MSDITFSNQELQMKIGEIVACVVLGLFSVVGFLGVLFIFS